MAERLFDEVPTEVVYYAEQVRGWYNVPRLVCVLKVARATATQLIVAHPNGEVRFRRDDGSLVGGKYGSAKVKPVMPATAADVCESQARRRVHKMQSELQRVATELGKRSVSTMPLALVYKLEPLLAQSRAALELTLTALNEEKPDES